MSNGYYPNGAEPNGYTAPFVAPTERKPPAARRWDAATRRWLSTPAHPVDARMMFGLTVELGSLPSTPGIGIDRRKISETPLPRREAAVRDEIARVTAPWVRAGDIEIRAIVVDLSTRGTTVYAVDYVNLRTGKPDTVRAGA